MRRPNGGKISSKVSTVDCDLRLVGGDSAFRACELPRGSACGSQIAQALAIALRP